MNTIPLQSVVWKSASLQDLSQYIYIFLHEVRVPAFKKSIVMFFPPEPMRFVYKITLILNLYRSIFITLSVMLFFWVQPWQCCLTLSSSKKIADSMFCQPPLCTNGHTCGGAEVFNSGIRYGSSWNTYWNLFLQVFCVLLATTIWQD